MNEQNENPFTEIKLTRTGKRPVALLGRELHTNTTRDHNSTRWTKLRVYESKTGKIVVAIGFMTCWEGEHNQYSAEAFESREDALAHIEE